jgi:DNA-directed RNA polymerase subunit RPC12/RpoP
MADFAAHEHLVIVRRCRDEPEAAIAKSVLESAGIKCFLSDDVTIRMNWGWSNALGGIKVSVKAEDVAAATEVLEQEVPERFEAEGTGEYEQPRCPNCQSLRLSLVDRDKPGKAVLGFALGVPVPVTRKGLRWRCDSCGHKWPDSGGQP